MIPEDRLTPYSVWQHVKKGNYYVVIGVGTCSTNGDRDQKERSVFYASKTGRLFYREVSEFLDGRFVRVNDPDS